MVIESGNLLMLAAGATDVQRASFDWNHMAWVVIESVVFAIIGLIVFGVAFLIIKKLTPFSIRKEIEDDQNTSLAVLIGAVMIGLAIIISAAIGL